MPKADSTGTLIEASGIGRREARLLMARLLGVSEAILAAFPEREIDVSTGTRFREWATRRRAGEPIAYILGEREFYGRSFAVSPAVLIPRPESELIIERAIECARAFEAPRILDLGTGSGAIAVTLACELARAAVTAADTSGAALGVAALNASWLASGRVELLESDWYKGLRGRMFEIIASNPPYIAAGDPHPEQGDLRFEPRLALVGGREGIECLAVILRGAPAHLAPCGWLIVEHGYDQGAQARRLFADTGFIDVSTWRDLAGLERVTQGRRAA